MISTSSLLRFPCCCFRIAAKCFGRDNVLTRSIEFKESGEAGDTLIIKFSVKVLVGDLFIVVDGTLLLLWQAEVYPLLPIHYNPYL